MRRSTAAGIAAGAALAASASAEPVRPVADAFAALPAVRCVGPQATCFKSLQAAVKAARDGDTITVAKGSYAGAEIDKSIKLIGAGARATTFRGGGPVVTVGSRRGKALTVSISGVTISGGVSHSNRRGTCGPDIPECGPGYVRATALGGGMQVLPNAIVTVSDSIVSGNRAAPTTAVPSVRAKCPDGPCPFAQAAGGGIDNWGTLTLVRTTVSDNEAGGGLTAQTNGGGIVSEVRSRLTLIDSTVSRNRAIAAPNGRFSAGGGIYVDRFGTLVIRRSVVSNNHSSLVSTYPKSVGDMSAHTAGIFVGNGGAATIERTTIAGNAVTIADLEGQPIGYDAGLCVCGPRTSLVMRDSRVTNNRLTVRVGTSTAVSGGSGGGLSAAGEATITGSRIAGNRVSVESPAGVALAVAVVNLFGARTATVSDSVISGNSVSASSTTGSARIQGVGLAINGPAELTNVRVTGNRGRATATTGWIHGGGIFNGLVFKTPKPALTLRGSTVTGNAASGGPGIVVQGGGVYTKGFRVKREQTVVARNTPDQCFGC